MTHRVSHWKSEGLNISMTHRMSHNESYLNIEAMRQNRRHREVQGRQSERERVIVESDGCEATGKRKKENEGRSSQLVNQAFNLRFYSLQDFLCAGNP